MKRTIFIQMALFIALPALLIGQSGYEEISFATEIDRNQDMFIVVEYEAGDEFEYVSDEPTIAVNFYTDIYAHPVYSDIYNEFYFTPRRHGSTFYVDSIPFQSIYAGPYVSYYVPYYSAMPRFVMSFDTPHLSVGFGFGHSMYYGMPWWDRYEDPWYLWDRFSYRHHYIYDHHRYGHSYWRNYGPSRLRHKSLAYYPDYNREKRDFQRNRGTRTAVKNGNTRSAIVKNTGNRSGTLRKGENRDQNRLVNRNGVTRKRTYSDRDNKKTNTDRIVTRTNRTRSTTKTTVSRTTNSPNRGKSKTVRENVRRAKSNSDRKRNVSSNKRSGNFLKSIGNFVGRTAKAIEKTRGFNSGGNGSGKSKVSRSSSGSSSKGRSVSRSSSTKKSSSGKGKSSTSRVKKKK